MATNYLRSAAHAVRTAFRFSQRGYHGEDMPVVLIPEAAWPEFVSAARFEMGPQDFGPRTHPISGAYLLIDGIRFEPGATAHAERDRPLTPLETSYEDTEDAELWARQIAGYIGGEKHMPRVSA